MKTKKFTKFSRKPAKFKLPAQARRSLVEACVQLLLHPDYYDQGEPDVPRMETRHDCGTTGCICGFICLQVSPQTRSRMLGPDMDLEGLSQRITGLSSSQIALLYWSNEWPDEFEDLYCHSVNGRQRALVAVARIRHFIRTGE